ncbi:MAG: metabolite traffic protein EboE [Cytophagales bacterium]|nr:metabolite traffic protein EboE [Bernardetiaceae bacterium]MDW8203752.1 metabolite traffic protein EboE [Cytophagales bacterium]
MQLADTTHLTYCTNIHPGESWAETAAALHYYIPAVKKQVCPNGWFGVGLRLSDLASRELINPKTLSTFAQWLHEQQAYVFTINGFPFGRFHYQKVKENVHLPDWTTDMRVDYTFRLAEILAQLLPEGLTGSISTSPLSYALWYPSSEQCKMATRKAAAQLARAALALFRIFERTGKLIHIDLEPEPDGIMENLPTTLQTFQQFIFPAMDKLAELEKIDTEHLRRHVQLCYDVCHFAVAYENHQQALAQLQAAAIPIGKFQLSAALRVVWHKLHREAQRQALASFNEPVYLHQVVARTADNQLLRFPDLPLALADHQAAAAAEWRVHFHVPIFLANYGLIQSTQSDIQEVLKWQQLHRYSSYLEVETYTWSVLPADMQLPLAESIARELQWVLQNYAPAKPA